MKFEVTYVTNADYFKTYENAMQNPHVKGLSQTDKGHIFITLKNFSVKIELSPLGTLVLFCGSEEEKEKVFPILKQILAPLDEQLKIQPLNVNVWNVPYSMNDKFSLPWCDENYSYKPYKTPWYWDEIDKEIAELQLRILNRKMQMSSDFDENAEVWGSPFILFSRQKRIYSCPYPKISDKC